MAEAFFTRGSRYTAGKVVTTGATSTCVKKSQYCGDVTESDLENWKLDADLCQAINAVQMEDNPSSKDPLYDRIKSRNNRFMVQVDDRFLSHGCTPPWMLHCQQISGEQDSSHTSVSVASPQSQRPLKTLKIVQLKDSLPKTGSAISQIVYLSSSVPSSQSTSSSSDFSASGSITSSIGKSLELHQTVPDSANIIQAPDPLSLGVGLHHYGLVDWSTRGINSAQFPICQTPEPLSVCPDPITHKQRLTKQPLPLACSTCWSAQRRGFYPTVKHNPYAAYYRSLRKDVKANYPPPQVLFKQMQKYAKLWRHSIKVNRTQFNALLKEVDKEIDKEPKPKKSSSHNCGKRRAS